jgi:hypothetical protein
MLFPETFGVKKIALSTHGRLFYNLLYIVQEPGSKY